MSNAEYQEAIKRAYQFLMVSPVERSVLVKGMADEVNGLTVRLNLHENGIVSWGNMHERVKIEVEEELQQARAAFEREAPF